MIPRLRIWSLLWTSFRASAVVLNFGIDCFGFPFSLSRSGYEGFLLRGHMEAAPSPEVVLQGVRQQLRHGCVLWHEGLEVELLNPCLELFLDDGDKVFGRAAWGPPRLQPLEQLVGGPCLAELRELELRMRVKLRLVLADQERSHFGKPDLPSCREASEQRRVLQGRF